jgi:sec-independent protein translocase protein TatA
MNASLAVLGLSGGELIVVLVAILVLFGAKRIPEFAKGLGQGIKEFKKASNEVTQEFQNAMETDYRTPPSRPNPPTPAALEAPAPEHGENATASTSPTVASPNTPPSTVPKT